MIPQSKGKIFLAQERGTTQSDWFKSNNTFNYGLYQQEHKAGFESLHVLNDDILAANRFIKVTADADSSLVLIPLIGAVQYFDSLGKESMLVSGQLKVFSLSKGVSIILKNPYKNEAVHFLQLWIKNVANSAPTSIFASCTIDLDGDLNKLVPVFSQSQFTISLGKFTGRHDGIYQTKKQGNALFAFVIDGEMEVQYRLLQSRDGLGLWDVSQLEFEALSATAILLVAEIPVIQS